MTSQTPNFLEDVAKGSKRRDVLLRRFESGAHRVDCSVCSAETAPGFHPLMKLILIEALDTNPRINAEVLTITARSIERLMEQIQMALEIIVGHAAARE